MQDDPIGNLNTAFEVAEKYLDIPKMLDAEGEDKASLGEDSTVPQSDLHNFAPHPCSLVRVLPAMALLLQEPFSLSPCCSPASEPAFPASPPMQ